MTRGNGGGRKDPSSVQRVPALPPQDFCPRDRERRDCCFKEGFFLWIPLALCRGHFSDGLGGRQRLSPHLHPSAAERLVVTLAPATSTPGQRGIS